MADHGINPTLHRSVLRTAHKVRTEDATPQITETRDLFFDSREFQGYPFPGGFYKSCNDRPAISSREVGIRGGVLLRFHFLIATNGCLVAS